jgi:hypothetical protein
LDVGDVRVGEKGVLPPEWVGNDLHRLYCHSGSYPENEPKKKTIEKVKMTPLQRGFLRLFKEILYMYAINDFDHI